MERHEGKEKFERGHVGDDQLLRGTQKCGIFFKGTQLKTSAPSAWQQHPYPRYVYSSMENGQNVVLDRLMNG
jgi:hypothetical protein